MNDVSWSGRLPGNASSDRNGGNSLASPGTRSWNTRSGREQIAEPVLAEVNEVEVGSEGFGEQLLGAE